MVLAQDQLLVMSSAEHFAMLCGWFVTQVLSCSFLSKVWEQSWSFGPWGSERHPRRRVPSPGHGGLVGADPEMGWDGGAAV